MRSLIGQSIKPILIGILFCLCSSIAVADVVVVVSAQSEVGQLQRVNVENIFFGRNYSFPSGADAIPLDLDEGSAERDEFYIKLAGRTAAQVKAFWAKLIFTGRGRPPAIANDEEDLIGRLIANPNAIGYIDSSNVDDRVKVVFRPMLITEDSSDVDGGSSFLDKFGFSTRFLAVTQ
tara:strand:+ start:282 stop:812 length:531 start_codon:yes stop_codon:yes gene_type:complete